MNVTLTNRTFTAGEWTGVIFPFSATKAQLDTTFGEGGYIVEEFSAINGNTIQFTMMETPTIVAGTPYIIKTNTTQANPVFPEVTFATSLTDNWVDMNIASDLSFRGFYFNKYAYQLVDGQSSPYNAYWINSNGSLANYLANEIPWQNEGYVGTTAFFFTTTKGNVTLTLNLEQTGSGNSGGDNGGGSSTSLEAKIANKEQLTDVPTIYLTIDLNDVSSIDNWGKEYNDDGSDMYRRATIQVVDASGSLEEFIDDGLNIKVRGNSTASVGNGKRPYRLKFDKDVKTDGVVTETHKHDLLGSGYKKRNWTLLANAFDNSMIRNAITYHIGQYVGLPFCPGYKFVDLVINGSYRGTYQVSDHVEVGSNRIDINEDTDWYLEGVAWETMVEAPNTTNGQPYLCIKNPEPETEAEVEALVEDVTNWRTEWLNSFDNGTFDKTNDLESLVKYYIAINITGDLDGWFVFKGSRTPTGPFVWGPLWDKDLAYGNHNDAKDDKMVEYYNKCNFEWKIQALQTNSKFMNAVKAKMDELMADGLYDRLASDIDNLAATIDQTQALNFTKYNINDASWAKVSFATYPEYITQLKEWLQARITFVQNQVNTFVNNLPAPTEGTYNPSNAWWSTGLSANTNYNMSVSNGHALTANTWNTLCLPFDASQDKMERALGCTYELKVHSGMAADGETMLFSAPASLDITAGVPYLIKPSQNVTTFGKFNEVYYSVNVNNGQNAYNGDGVTFDNKHYFYASLFHGYEVSTSTDYLFNNDTYTEGSNSAFTKATSNNPHDGMRAFIRVTDGTMPTISFSDGDEPATRGQLTDVPTIYIDADGTIDADVWGTASIEVYDSNNMIGGDFTLASTGLSIKYKGDGTAEKPSYRLKFTKKQAFLGTKSGTYKQWVLQANDDDPTMLRNALTKELGDQMGFAFTPGYQFADVYVNDTYMGTYQITDRVKVESGRVLANDKDNDWLVQVASVGEVDTRTDGNGDWYIEGDTTTPYLIIKNPDKDDLTADQITALTESVRSYFNDTFWNDIENNVDQASFVNWYISSEILAAYKQLSSTYTYRDATNSGKLFFGPLNGNEKAYDNNTKYPMDMSDIDTEGSYNGMIFTRADYGVMRNKLQALWQEEWFKEAVLAKWNTIYGSDATTDVKAALLSKLTTLANEIAQTKEYNYKATADGGAGWTLDGSYDDEVAAISTYLNSRFAYLDKKFKELASASNVLIGDANGDGRVDVTDLIVCVNYVLDKNPTTFFFNNADADGNGKITMNDVTIITNIILNQ
ncbi:MAG: CotH kinase family protein [Prevotella sp.]|nr:CotH kinase family protein [Prevotella sp.]